MGVSVNCTGRNLYNHLIQKNVPVKVTYTYNKMEWDGTMTLYDTTYQVNGLSNKTTVLEELMKQAEDVIYTKLSVKR